MRTIPGMEEYIKPLDDLITWKFLPNLVDSIVTEEERESCFHYRLKKVVQVYPSCQRLVTLKFNILSRYQPH